MKARVISTTSRNLDEEMRAGRFRSELYYRINGVCLRLPPLRERKEDIPMLAEFLFNQACGEIGSTAAVDESADASSFFKTIPGREIFANSRMW